MLPIAIVLCFAMASLLMEVFGSISSSAKRRTRSLGYTAISMERLYPETRVFIHTLDKFAAGPYREQLELKSIQLLVPKPEMFLLQSATSDFPTYVNSYVFGASFEDKKGCVYETASAFGVW